MSIVPSPDRNTSPSQSSMPDCERRAERCNADDKRFLRSVPRSAPATPTFQDYGTQSPSWPLKLVAPSCLLRLDSGLADHAAPALPLVVEERGELSLCAGGHRSAHAGEPRRHVRLVDRFGYGR